MAPRGGPSPKAGPPYRVPGKMDPKSTTFAGELTPSNRSRQTPQAAAQNVPQGIGTGAGTRLLAGAGSTKPVHRNGRMGK